MRTLDHKSIVLYIGNEPLLSKSSSALLRTAGYRVRATNPRHTNEAVREGHFGVVVLCPTLSNAETNAIIESLERDQPGVPIVSLHVGHLGDVPHPASSCVADVLQGPDALLRAVRSVTQPRQRAS